MPNLWNVIFCALVATIFWTCVGLPLARRLAPERPLALAMAPALGWSVFNAAALPVLWLVGFTWSTVAVLSGVALAVAIVAIARPQSAAEPAGAAMPGIPWWAYAAAAVLAAAPAVAIMPKFVGDGVILGAPIYDHAKVAIIDDIARLGLPPGNPFFGEAGDASRLAYYYLWHFGAAVWTLLLRTSGWEADIALTWFTAFASLNLMMGFAVRFSGCRSAALWVVLLSVAVSLRPILSALLGEDGLDRLISPYADLQSWIVQASWVPQHLASATAVVLAAFLISRLASRGSVLTVPVLGLVVAAAFESSTWIGGITFAVAAVPLGLVLLRCAPSERRVRFAIEAAIAAGIAGAIVFPFLRDEFVATAARAIGVPIVLRPYRVLGGDIPEAIRRILDLPAYWVILLVIQFPAIYLAGSLAWFRTVRRGETPPGYKPLAAALAALALVGVMVAWLFASTIANNDLGWRAVLPSVLVLTIFAAAGIARWLAAPLSVTTMAAIALFALGLPDGFRFIGDNASGIPSASAAAFAESPDLWRAVRRYAAPGDRVGSNPLLLADMLGWPVNISWALFSDRRSCFASWDLAIAYVALPTAQVDGLLALFTRVFSGQGSAEDVRTLAARYGCRVVAVTASDGAWSRDEFAASPYYRLAEVNAGKWRIYVATESIDKSR